MDVKKIALLLCLAAGLLLQTSAFAADAGDADQAGPVEQGGMKRVGLAPMKRVELAPMKRVELAPMKRVGLAPMKRVELAPMKRVGLAPMKRTELAPMKRTEPAQPQESSIDAEAQRRGKIIDPNGQGLNQAQINAMERQRQLMWNATGPGMVYR